MIDIRYRAFQTISYTFALHWAIFNNVKKAKSYIHLRYELLKFIHKLQIHYTHQFSSSKAKKLLEYYKNQTYIFTEFHKDLELRFRMGDCHASNLTRFTLKQKWIVLQQEFFAIRVRIIDQWLFKYFLFFLCTWAEDDQLVKYKTKSRNFNNDVLIRLKK